MKIFVFRAVAFASAGIIAGSVLSVAFPGSMPFPVFIFALAIAIALSRGFLDGLPAVIALGIFADIATFGRIGILSGFAVGVAYTASFFSRRFIVEHVALTVIFSGALSGIAATAFPVFSDMFLFGADAALSRIFTVFLPGHVVPLLLFGVVSFFFSMSAIRRYDDFASRIDPGSAVRL